jgi:uncharacterized protein
VANVLLINATELLREPGTRRRVDAAIPLVDVDVHDPRLAGDVAVDVTLASTLDDVEVTGALTVGWSDTCRRCLRAVGGPLVIDVDERYAVEDPDAFPIEHGQIDLASMVRENVLLGVPDAPLCREDCPGLCPICGADLEADPDHEHDAVRDERWAALDQLRTDD